MEWLTKVLWVQSGQRTQIVKDRGFYVDDYLELVQTPKKSALLWSTFNPGPLSPDPGLSSGVEKTRERQTFALPKPSTLNRRLNFCNRTKAKKIGSSRVQYLPQARPQEVAVPRQVEGVQTHGCASPSLLTECFFCVSVSFFLCRGTCALRSFSE